jgi:hypothetical protein
MHYLLQELPEKIKTQTAGKKDIKLVYGPSVVKKCVTDDE